MTSTHMEGIAAVLLGLLILFAFTVPLCLSHLERTQPVAPAAQTVAHHVAAPAGTTQN